MSTYLLNAFSVLLYAFVDYGMRMLQHSTMRLRPRKTQSPGGASPVLFSLLMLQEVLFLGTRTATVGVDTPRYVFVFENALWSEPQYEIGYNLFVKLLRTITPNENFFLFVVAAASLLPIGFAVFRLSKMPYLSWYVYICMFYFTFNFSGLRQSIAMALTFLAFYFLCREKKLSAVLCALAAVLFHTSAVVFLVAFLLYYSKWKKWKIPVLAVAYLAIFLLRAPIFRLMLRLLYEDYDLADTQAYTWMLVNLALFFILLFLGFRTKDDRVAQFGLTVMSVGVAFFLLTSVGTNVVRAANYFSMYIILVCPNVIKALNKQIRPIAVLLSVGVLTVFYVIHLRGNPYEIIPYHSVLF